jgi:glycosyltransferase involved in cell wall biosynthesis
MLLEALLGAGYRTFCAQRPEDTPLQARLKEKGVEYFWFDIDPEAEAPAFMQDKLRPAGIFGAARPDLILFSNGHPLLSFAAIQTAIFLGVPYLIRDGAMAPQLLPKASRDVEAIKRNYLTARAAIATCEQNLEVLRAALGLPPDFGLAVFDGLSPEFVEAPDPEKRGRRRAELGVDDDQVLCLTVGKLEQAKGYDLLLRAIRGLKEGSAWSRLHFAWAGEGSRRAEIEQGVNELGVADRVTLLGHQWEIASWYDAADIFVLPSRFEGICNALQEAMAKGLPAVATAAGGMPEALGETGKVIAAPDKTDAVVHELVETITGWAEDADLRRRFGEACRARALSHFSQERMVNAYLEIIERALRPAEA